MAALSALLPVLAACTSSGSGGTPRTNVRTVVETRTPTPSATALVPLSSGPTTTRSARACPWAPQAATATIMGERLGRVTVQVSGGRTVGCRFYALQHPNDQCDASCLAAEHLPGPNQPVVAITTQRYASTVAAHNAFVLLGIKERNAQQAAIGATTGVCFQTPFYPADKGQDWACATSKGTTMLLVNSVDTTGSFGTSTLTAKVLGAL